jgi:hypothetical protein
MATRSRSKPPQSFQAAIYRVGILYCVDVPASLTRSLGGGKYIPVAGAVNGAKMRGLLVPRGDGQHRLFLDTKIRKAAKAGQGDVVTLALGPDPESREIPIPDEVLEAFEDEPGSLEVFQALSQAKRREVLLWILKAKHAETRAKRIAIIIGALAKRKL